MNASRVQRNEKTGQLGKKVKQLAPCKRPIKTLNGRTVTTQLKRDGKIIGVKAEKLEECKRLLAAVWPEVNALIGACQMRNFTNFPPNSG